MVKNSIIVIFYIVCKIIFEYRMCNIYEKKNSVILFFNVLVMNRDFKEAVFKSALEY